MDQGWGFLWSTFFSQLRSSSTWTALMSWHYVQAQGSGSWVMEGGHPCMPIACEICAVGPDLSSHSWRQLYRGSSLELELGVSRHQLGCLNPGAVSGTHFLEVRWHGAQTRSWACGKLLGAKGQLGVPTYLSSICSIQRERNRDRESLPFTIRMVFHFYCLLNSNVFKH